MNKGLHSKSHLKFFAYTFVLISSLFTFISCENFLQGEEVKEEITKAIEYNNAQTYTINVEALDGSGKIKTPAACEVTKKVTDVFTIRFEPAEDHKFIKWEAIVKGMSTGEKASDYIEFENSESQETKVTLKKGSNQVIEIRPVCPPRLTYTFTQGAGDLYPRDTAIELNFNQKLSNCNLNTTPISYITIPNLDEGEDSEKYFKAPVVTDQKIIFRAETKEGTNFIPVPNNSRSVQVRIPKDEVWYVNKDYSEPIEVYLDSDIVVSYLIGTSTSAKTKVKYEIRQKDGQPLGIFKINGNDKITEDSYSVGETVALRYWIPEGYSFNKWKFINSKGEECQSKDLSLTLTDQNDESDPIQLNLTFENYVKDGITIVPEIYDPVEIKFVKDSDDKGTLKAGSNTIAVDETARKYAVKESFAMSYKVPAGYSFYGWNYTKTYKDTDGKDKTENITEEALKEQFGFEIVYDTDGDENGYDKTTRLAQAQITIRGYTDNVISVKPLCYQNLEITSFNLSNSDSIYSRDSTLKFTFNTNIATACKDNYSIKIPGLEEDKTYADYFEPAVFDVTSKTLTIKAKDADSDHLIPLLADGTNTITLTFNPEVYYEVVTPAGKKEKIYLSSGLNYSYKINAETDRKTNLQFVIDNQDAGTFLVDGEYKGTNAFAYSIGKTLNLRYKIDDIYVFDGWEFIHTHNGTSETYNFEDNTVEDLQAINLGISFDPAFEYAYGYDNINGVITANITVLNKTDGSIKIHPKVIEAPTTSVTISGNRGSFSPSAGTFTTKQNFPNTISFEPESNFEFICWEMYDVTTGKALDEKQKYISIDDKYKNSITYRVVQIPENSDSEGNNSAGARISLGLRPILAPRPKVISNTPLNTGNVLRDTTIQVIFDYAMAQESVYYSEDELLEKRIELGIDLDKDEADHEETDKEFNKLLYFTDSNSEKIYYGYIKKDENTQKYETYFKNIFIKNRQTGENMLPCFEAPVFERDDTLSIGIKRKGGDGDDKKDALIKKYSQIIVSIGDDTTGENVFYKVDEKSVKMASSFTWYYQVNDKGDENAPRIIDAENGNNNKPILKTALAENEEELSYSDSIPAIPASGARNQIKALSHFSGGNFDLRVKLDDQSNGSGMSPSFTVVCQKIYNENYELLTNGEIKNIGIEYSYVAGQMAEYAGECSLGALTDGVYSMKFKFFDKSGNECCYPEGDNSAYYFCIDGTGPELAQNTMRCTTDSSIAGKITTTWDTTGINDYEKSCIWYKEIDEEQYHSIEVPGAANSYVFNDLIPGKRYNFYAVHYDVWGNNVVQESICSAYAKPDVPTVTIGTAHGTTANLAITKPENGVFNGLNIRYTPVNTASWIEKKIESADDTTVEAISLPNGTKYWFEVCSYIIADDGSYCYSKPFYTSGTTLPTYATLPAAPSFTTLPANSSYTNKIEYKYTTPNSPFSNLYLYYRADGAAWSDSNRFVISDSAQNHTATYPATGLLPGTTYYFKLVANFDTADNKVESNSDWCRTKTAPVASFTKGTVTNNSIIVNWTKPASGGCSGYVIYHKKSTESSYPKSTDAIAINSVNTLSYTLENLEGGTTYEIKIRAKNNNESEDSSVLSIQTYPNAVTNVTAENLSSTKTKLSWTCPTGNYTSLILYKASSADFSNAVPYELTKGTVYKEVDVSQGSTSYYKVRTYISDTLYTDSESVICSTDISPVTGASVTANGTNSISIKWTNPVGEYKGVRIYRSTSGYSTASSNLVKDYTDKTTTAYTIPNLTPNTYYYIVLQSYVNVKKSNGGTEVTEEKVSETRLSYYTRASLAESVSATVTSPTTVSVSWKNPSDTSYWSFARLYVYQGSSYVTYYSISKGTASSTQTQTVSNLTPGTSYTFKVLTYNNNSTVNVDYENYTVTKTTTPAPVTNFTVTDTTKQGVSFSWTKPEGNYTGIKIWRKDGSSWSLFADEKNTSTTSKTYDNVTTLTPGCDYVFKAETYLNGVTNLSDGSSETSTINAYTRPDAPTGFGITSRGTGYLTLGWSNPTNYDGVYFYYRTSPSGSWSAVNVTGSTSKKITGLTAGTKYEFYLKAYNYSTTYSTTTSSITTCTTPATVTGVTVAAYNGGTKVSWSNPGGNRDYYALYYSTNGSSWTCADSTISSTATSYTFSNSSVLSNSTNYYFKVQGRTYSSKDSAYVPSYDSNTPTFYTPPIGLSSATKYSDDGFGTVRIRFYTGASSTSVDAFVNESYVTCSSYSGSGYKYITVNIPNYSRGTNYTIRIAPYHGKNNSSGDTATWTKAYPGETYGTSVTVIAYNDNGDLYVNGSSILWTRLKNVITSNYTVTKNTSRTGGAFSSGRIVTMKPYSMGAYEVTQQLFTAVMGTNPSSSQSDYYPVSNVNWYHAIAFCNKLSAMQGLTPCYSVSGISDWENLSYSSIPTSDDSNWNKATYNFSANGYHLPTEAEWEFAARGGSTAYTDWSYEYAGGDTRDNVGWTSSNSGGYAHQVGCKTANRLGLYDMTGNVWEWLTDWNYTVPDGTFTDPYCSYNSSANAPYTMSKKEGKILAKGAAYGTKEHREIDYNSEKASPTYRASIYGFRICRHVTY